MESFFIAANFILLFAFVIYFIVSSKKIAKITNEIDDLKLEQSKLNFRLFVAEKKQKIYKEKNCVNN